MGRPYGFHTVREDRETWTDKLNDCGTWQQVLDLPDPADSDYLRGMIHMDKEYYENLPPPDPDPTWPAASHELVEGWVAQLPRQERAAFTLIHLESMSLRAAAPYLKCSHETARVRFERARRLMIKIVTRHRGIPLTWKLG